MIATARDRLQASLPGLSGSKVRFMRFTVQNVYGLIIRSRLLALDDAKAMYERWQSESKGAVENVELFARWMVTHHYVTEYQAMLLLRGHADGFYLNQYKIIDRLGRGRMAGVYKAAHALGQVVAIKVLPPSKAQDRQMLARFQREARLAMRLKHPNVVRSYQVAWATGLHYIVMEYLDGETLEEVLQRRRRLPPGESVRLIYQALQGLQHIHEQKLVHRDLKPSNLMLVPGREPGKPDTTLSATLKILDIGLGRTFFDDVNPASSSVEEPQLTGEGVLLGTPDYLAPEQARNARAVDIRADIYSLGCVLYHCVAGQPPFPDTNIITQMIRHATEVPRPLKEFNPEVPDGLQQIVNWMLAKDPAQRYPTPERAAQALQMFLAAGVEANPVPAVDAKMKTYLTWLESNSQSAPPAPMSQKPGPVARVKTWLAGKHTPRKHHRSKKHKHKHKPPAGLPAAPKAGGTPGAPMAIPVPSAGADPMAGIDVELVPVVRRKKKRRHHHAPAGGGLSRRDFFLAGGGAAAVLLAIGGGFLVAKIRDRFKPPEQSEEPENPEPQPRESNKTEPEPKAPEPKNAEPKGKDEKGMEKKEMEKKGG
jgi:serine/threonine protein kinase